MNANRTTAEALRRQRAQQQAELRRASLRLGGEIGEVAAPVATGTSRARSLAVRFAESVNVLDYGAVGDGVTDDSAALQAAADAARAGGKRLYAPAGDYRIASTVTIRRVETDFAAATITVDSADAMLVIGGDARRSANPTQEFYMLRRLGGATVVPTCRVMGSKGQSIIVDSCDYLQIYADTSTGDTGPDYSIAYSTFYLDYCRKLDLSTNDATSNSQTQWINENTFFLKRSWELIIRGTYAHNHNTFYGGAFEGLATIDIQRGSSNVFWGTRFEGGEATVKFGELAWSNKVFGGWDSNHFSQFRVEPPAIVIDEGEGNFVSRLSRLALTTIPIIEVGQHNCQVFTDEPGTINTPRAPNYTSLRGVDVQRHGIDTFRRSSNRGVYDSGLIPIRKGEAIRFNSDAMIWRPRISLYDANRNKLTSDFAPDGKEYARNPGTSWSSSSHWYSAGANLAGFLFSIAHKDVAFVRVDLYSGSNLSVPFEGFALHLVTANFSPERVPLLSRQQAIAVAVAGPPTRGFAQLGTKLSNIAGGWFTAVRALDTTLAANAASGAASVTLADATGVEPGDVIGADLGDGAAHWTTVISVDGDSVTLAAALPAAVASGSRVVSNGWIAA